MLLMPIVKIEVYDEDRRRIYKGIHKVDHKMVRKILDLLMPSKKSDIEADEFNLATAVLWALNRLNIHSEDKGIDAWSIAKIIANDELWYKKASRYYGVQSRRELVSRIAKAIGPVTNYLIKKGIVNCKQTPRGRLYWLNILKV